MSQLIFVRSKAPAASPVFPGKGGGLRGRLRLCREGRGCFPGQLPGRDTMGIVSLQECGSEVAFLALHRASPFILVLLSFSPFVKKTQKVTLVGIGAHKKSNNSVLNREPTVPPT